MKEEKKLSGQSKSGRSGSQKDFKNALMQQIDQFENDQIRKQAMEMAAAMNSSMNAAMNAGNR